MAKTDVAGVKHARTPAQWYCILIGATLLLVGVLGFIADSTFDTGGSIDGDRLFGFEVNGWHNLVHVASGVLLLAAANAAPTAKLTAIVFGAAYGLVALIGLVDGNDVLGVIPVNGADNVLHLLLSALGIAAGLASRTFRREVRVPGRGRERGARRRRTAEREADTAGPSVAGGEPGTGRFAREERDGVVVDPGGEEPR